MHLLSSWSAAAVDLAASADPSVPATTDDQYRSIGPGFVGFVATAAMVIVVIFLIWDMTRRIRRIRYQPDQEQRQEELVAMGEEEAAQRVAREKSVRSEAVEADDEVPAAGRDEEDRPGTD